MSERVVIEKIQEFIQRILSKEINDETLISLTSAQVAAFELFLNRNKINKINKKDPKILESLDTVKHLANSMYDQLQKSNIYLLRLKQVKFLLK